MLDILDRSHPIDCSQQCVQRLLLLRCPGDQAFMWKHRDDGGHRGARNSRPGVIGRASEWELFGDRDLWQKNPFKRPLFLIQTTEALLVRGIALPMLIFQVNGNDLSSGQVQKSFAAPGNEKGRGKKSWKKP